MQSDKPNRTPEMIGTNYPFIQGEVYMKSRRFLLALSVFALIAVVVSGCHPHRFGGNFPKGLLEHIDSRVEDLQLTAEQEDQYLALRARLEADLLQQKTTHEQFRQSMKEFIDQEPADLKEVTARLRTKANEVPDIADRYLDYIDEFYDILDDHQKAMVMQEIRDRADSRMFRQ